MTLLNTLSRAAGVGLCVLALSGTALADPGNGNGNGPATTPPGQEKKAETPAAPPPAPADASKAEEKKAEAPGQVKKAEKQKTPSAKATAPGQAKKAAKPVKASGSYKETSLGNDLKAGMAHKHTICHATGSSKNPFVVITPSVSGVFHGHIGHQGDEDIVPPFVYKGVTYSQNWDAEGQALFAANCAAPASATPLAPVTPAKEKDKQKDEKADCPATATTTQRVLVGVWHATGAFKNGQRKFVFITPSLSSAHYDSSKHADDIPVYDEQTVTTTASADSCNAATPLSQNITPPTSNLLTPEQPQPIVPTAAGQTPAPGAVGVLPASAGGVAGAVSPANAAVEKSDKPAGGVLGAVASAPEAVAETATSGTLPFTGIPLWIAALIGGALLATGLVLRRTT
jgi:hypothetical protein